jgi:hypothetical protein
MVKRALECMGFWILNGHAVWLNEKLEVNGEYQRKKNT